MADYEAAGLNKETARACGGRLGRLQEALETLGADGLLVSNEKDILYLTGFVGHDSLLVVFRGDAVILSDSRYDEFLEPWRGCGYAEVEMGVRHRLHETVAKLCAKNTARRLAIQAEALTVARLATFRGALGGVELVETSGVVATLRMKKDELEITRIEQAIDWQQQALRAALDKLHLDMTELQFAALLQYEMRTRGAFEASFDSIIGSGTNSSIIHYLPGSTPIREGTLLVDWGATTPDGYNSDLTRTFGIGHLPAKIREIYTIVADAQQAAIDACAPGRICAEIDAVARKVITDAGYGEAFAHGLGHGLGLDVHESPYFNDLQTDVVLEPGMVMTVEPGIYLPGVGGVRLEDDVLITGSGARVLSDYPKDLDSAIVEPGAVTA